MRQQFITNDLSSGRGSLRRSGAVFSHPMQNGNHSMTVVYSESHTTSSDGHSLFVRRFAPGRGNHECEVLLVHGYAEHSGRYRELAHALARYGIATNAVDLRGHGRSDGARGYIRHFEHYHDDLRSALKSLVSEVPVVIVAHSLGALISLDWIVSDHPPIAGLVLSSPFLALTQPPPTLKRLLVTVAAKLRPRLNIPSPLVELGLSRDKDVVAAYQRDPRVFSTINVNWLHEAMRAQTRVKSYRSLPCPLMFVYGSGDPIASPRASAMLAQQLNAPRKEIICREGALHEVFNELDRDHLHQEVANFIKSLRPS